KMILEAWHTGHAYAANYFPIALPGVVVGHAHSLKKLAASETCPRQLMSLECPEHRGKPRSAPYRPSRQLEGSSRPRELAALGAATCRGMRAAPTAPSVVQKAFRKLLRQQAPALKKSTNMFPPLRRSLPTRCPPVIL